MKSNFRDKEIKIDIDEIVKDEQKLLNDDRNRFNTANNRSSFIPPLFKKMLIVSFIFVLLTVFIYILLSTDHENKTDVVVNEQEDLKNISDRMATLSNSLATSYSELKGRIDQLEYDVSTLNEKIDGLLVKKGSIKSDKSLMKTSASSRYHIVRRGENTYKIARKYGMTLKELCAVNNISDKDIIRPGQKLIVR